MLDEETNIYYLRNKPIKLTNIEAQIVAYFIDHKDRMVLYKDLVEAIYEERTSKLPKKLIVWVHRVNKKLGQEIHIYSVKRIGYRMKYVGRRLRRR